MRFSGNVDKAKLDIEIGWLEKLSSGLKTLEDKDFKYDRFISKYDRKNDCGTVCCAFGWMPRFVPETDVKWIRGSSTMNASTDNTFQNISKAKILNDSDGMRFDGTSLIRFMFFGLDAFVCYNNINSIRKSYEIDKMNIKNLYDSFYEETNIPIQEYFGVGMNSNLQQVIHRIEFCIKILKTTEFA